MAKHLRPHERTLQILDRVGASASPEQIDQHVNIRTKVDNLGRYAWKHIWFLRKLGFGIESIKKDRAVVKYVLVSEPASSQKIRAGGAKLKKKTILTA